MMQLDPGLTFALGALCMLTLALLVGLGVALRFAAWGWGRFRESDDLALSRQDGKVKLAGTLVDLARPGRKRAPKSGTARRVSNGREERPS
jgi:hypothetical protein